MNSTDPNSFKPDDAIEASSKKPEVSEMRVPKTSSTTNDIPAFGWSDYAERINGRFAMIGFTAILLIEALSHITFLQWAGLMQ